MAEQCACKTGSDLLVKSIPSANNCRLHHTDINHYAKLAFCIQHSQFQYTLNGHSAALKQSGVWLHLPAVSDRPGLCSSLRLPPDLV